MGSSSSKNGGGATSGGSSAGPEAYSHADSAGSQAGSSSSHHSGTAGEGAGAVGMEPVGLVGGSTEHLIAEAEAAGAGIPNVDPTTGQLGELNPNGQWAALTPPVVEVICATVLPAWQIRKDDEQRPIAEALAECLDQVFPGGIEGKYACWVRLVFACGAITVSRVAQNGGRLPPLFLKSTQPAPKPTPPAASNGAAGPPRDPLTITSLTE
jgi:hypothetical protein